MTSKRISSLIRLINNFFVFRKNSYSSFMLNSKFHILAVLHHGDPDGTAISSIADTLNVSIASVSRTIKLMDEEGLVERVTDPDDRRTCYVKISDKGLKTYQDVNADIESFFGHVLDSYNKEEIDKFLELGNSISKDLLLYADQREKNIKDTNK